MTRIATIGFVAALGVMLAASIARADSPPVGNAVFQVLVEDTRSKDGVGVFGAVTGPEHPLGAGTDILGTDGGTDAFSSYVSVRSYTTGTDYVQTSGAPASGNLVVPLDQWGVVRSVSGGYEADYRVPEDGPASEALDITTGIVVDGAGDEASIRVYGSVTNRSPDPVVAGGRILLDLALDGDDGPAVSVGEQTFGNEAELAGAGPIVLSAGNYSLSALRGEADSVKFGHWNRAFESAFDFEPSGADVATAGGLDDSALLVYFGETEADATTLAPGETFEFAVTLEPAVGAEVCDNGEDDDGDGQVDGADPDCGTPLTPTVGASVSPVPTQTLATVSQTPPSTPASGGPAGFPNTGGPLGLDETAWWALAAIGAVLVAGGAVYVARRRRAS